MARPPAQRDAATTDADRVVRRLNTLADPARLRLLRLLEQEELGVAELCEVVQMPQSTVSRHLRVLTDDGWAVARRAGTTNLYRVHVEELDEAARSLWSATRDRLAGWSAFEQDAVRLAHRLAARATDSRSFFAGAAPAWDVLRTEMYGGSFTTHAVLALLPERWTVADLGCGTGVNAELLGRHVANVIAVDNSPEMLDAARRRTAPLGNVDVRQGDLADLPIDDDACDAALLILALTYIDDPAPALAEMARVLRPGGRGVIVDLMHHDRDDFRRQMGQRSLGFAPDRLAAGLANAGFADPTVTPLPPDPDTKGPALLLATAAAK
ncbi:MAG: metalloregulator ArsR/SmtB family transcription factor [Planctomycetota bacterium]